MSILSPIATFATDAYTVTRTGAGTYDSDGRLVAGSTSTFSIDAVVQPLRGRELRNLPEAQHGEEMRALLTGTELRARQPGNAGDTVSISSEDWEVVRLEPWSFRGTSFWRAIIARKAAS